jgi:hypothetical protein
VTVRETLPTLNEEHPDAHHRHPKQVKVKTYDFHTSDKFWASHKGRWVFLVKQSSKAWAHMFGKVHCYYKSWLLFVRVVWSASNIYYLYKSILSKYFAFILKPISHRSWVNTERVGWIQSIRRGSEKTKTCHGRYILKFVCVPMKIITPYQTEGQLSLQPLSY